MTDAPAQPAAAIAPLLIAAAGTIAIGLVAHRRDLVRGGARLAAVPLAAAAIGALVRRLDPPRAEAGAPPPVMTEAMATWLAQALVNAALARLDPVIEATPVRREG